MLQLTPPQALPRRSLFGGLALVACLQYFVAEAVAAAAWSDPPYDWRANYISDLGVPECGPSQGRAFCSPAHQVMNLGFVTQSVLVATALVLLTGYVRRGRWAVTVFGAAYCVGVALVGLFPGSVAAEAADSARNTAHGLGATLAIVGGNLLVLSAAVALWPHHRRYAAVSLALGALGLTAAALFPFTDLGLGVGTVERLAVNPIVVWLVITGACVLRTRRIFAP